MSEFIDAPDLFLFIASVSLVAITLVVIVVGYQLAKLLEEARGCIRSFKEEIDVFTEGRRALFYRATFARTWLSNFIRILITRS